jgi:hypothetical protein
MKLQMVEQNRLSNRQLKGSKMPILDIRFEKIEPPDEIGGGQFHYNYDVVIHNKGSGPAFNVHLQRLVSETRGQKEALRNPPRMQIEHLHKSINIIGAGEAVRVHRERSDSYRSFTIIVRFSDVFKENGSSGFQVAKGFMLRAPQWK